MIWSRSSKPASSMPLAMRWYVRALLNDSRCPPGLSTRSTSRAQSSLNSWNARMPAGARLYFPASAAIDLCPPFGPASGACEANPRRRSARASMSAPSHAFPMKRMPYGGSVTTASTLLSAKPRMTLRQSPLCRTNGAVMPVPPSTQQRRAPAPCLHRCS